MRLFSVFILGALAATPAFADEHNAYTQTNFVANKTKYHGNFATDKRFVNAWGVAIRPAKAGGHFWVTAKDVSYEYVGDVHASDNPKLQKLFQDNLAEVKLPIGGKDNFATGVVFNGNDSAFVITQDFKGGEPITNGARFLFASDGGIISAWAERKKEDGSYDRPVVAIPKIDMSKDGAQFFGLAINKANDRLYAANFGENPDIKVFDSEFKPANVTFDMPFDENKNGKVDPGEYAPFNVQTLVTPSGDSHVFVTYAMTQPCPEEEVKKGTCKAGELFVGEEFTDKPGQGRVAEFTEDGKLVAVWKDGGKLSAPWGIAYAPENFGALSGMLLVGNFGDGSIAAYDAKTREFVDMMKDAKGKPVKIEKIWGFLFGNGDGLGDKNAMYFAAGPDDENDGLFGSIRPVTKTQ